MLRRLNSMRRRGELLFLNEALKLVTVAVHLRARVSSFLGTIDFNRQCEK
jgi:hypothetical protein